MRSVKCFRIFGKIKFIKIRTREKIMVEIIAIPT